MCTLAAFSFMMLFILCLLTIPTSSQFNTSTTTTIIDDNDFQSSTFYFSTTEFADIYLNDGRWLYATIVTAFLGIILISIMGIHAIYHLFHDNLSGKCQRAFYVFFFIAHWFVCVFYAFFKTDIILPGMGHTIDCKVGYYTTTTAIYTAKLVLFIVFILRIDIAFHASALGYNRCFLLTITGLYAIIEAFAYLVYIYTSWNIVTYKYDDKLPVTVGQCTIGSTITTAHLILGVLSLMDIIASIFVCALFIYKLHKVVQMTAKHDVTSSKSNRKDSKNTKLLSLMKKQTILVSLAIITSFLVLGLGFVYSPVTQLLPLDALVNVFCVWLMFSFANDTWNKIIKYICCGCRCCGRDEHEFLQRQSTFSTSLRKRVSGFSRSGSTSKRAESVTSPSKQEHDITKLSSIAERDSVKHKNIEINFKNDIKSTDLQQQNNVNSNDNGVEMEQIHSEDEEERVESLEDNKELMQVTSVSHHSDD